MAFLVRAMSGAERAMAVDWARREGWNPGPGDAQAFAVADPLGFLVGVLDGEPVAAISAVRYDPGYGFIGFYIVAPRWRGQGHGIRVWRAGMTRLAGVATVGLDGVLAEIESYRRSGFEVAYRNRRYGGAPPSGAGSLDGLVDARDAPMRLLLDLDRHLFPAPRPAFLAQWIGQPGHRALAAVEDGRAMGLAVARPCAEGFKIGPLYARDRAMAERLVGAACLGMGAGPAFLDVPAVNAEAVALAEGLGWRVSFETARMYRGPAPGVDLARLYGVTTFELG